MQTIATRCEVGKTLRRKIVYGDRENPGVALTSVSP